MCTIKASSGELLKPYNTAHLNSSVDIQSILVINFKHKLLLSSPASFYRSLKHHLQYFLLDLHAFQAFPGLLLRTNNRRTGEKIKKEIQKQAKTYDSNVIFLTKKTTDQITLLR